MGNYMTNGAVVEPAAIHKMKTETDLLAENLKKSVTNMNNSLTLLNNAFQDSKFNELHQKMEQSNEQLTKLGGVMIEFSEYLYWVATKIEEYVNGGEIPKSGITIPD